MSTKETTLALRFNIRVLMALALLMLAMLAMLALGSGGAGSSARAAAPAGLNVQSAQPASKIEAKVLADTANGKTASFIVLMSEKANLTTAYSMKDQDARGWFVYNTLKETANHSQAGIRAYLDAQRIQYKSRWVANALLVTGDRAVVDMLAARSDVRAIEANRPMYLVEPIREKADKSSSPGAPSAPGAPSRPNEVEWGVANVRAPEVWAMGHTGQGIVVAGADTGIRWTHNALKPHYRGWNGATADHNYNWHDAIHLEDLTDPCGPDTQEPCDGHDHGTHTVGTAVGDDGMGNQIGVAPGAKWMGCRNMLASGVGFGAVFDTYAECFEFFIAPTKLDGTAPDPTKRPHVIINSWGCPEGCMPNTLRDIVEATQASGIMVEASAGNDGPACSTVEFPPAIYEASFTTGAIDIDNALADFSSRGPVATDGSLRLKPNISAPGVENRSAVMGSDDAYDEFSGTSMAGPHVVGVIALLWSARPELARQITETKVLLQMSANPDVEVLEPIPMCGDTTPEDIPNNFFGYGRVDALAAVQAGTGGDPSPTATSVVSATATSVVSPTATSVVSATATTVVSPTATSVVSATATSVVSATATSVVSATATTVVSPTATSVVSATATSVVSATATSVVSATATSIAVASATATTAISATATATTVASATATSAASPTACHIQFADVPSTGEGSTFYSFVRCLACRQIVGGYPCGGPDEPCNDSRQPYYRPGANVSRGQLSKIVANSASLNDPIAEGQQQFADVEPGDPFYEYVERLAQTGAIAGYPCDTAGEGCDEENRPFFRPNNPATRGQISKIVSIAAHFEEDIPEDQQTFTDVPTNSPFWVYIERLAGRGIISGYGEAEKCLETGTPCFRYNDYTSRGQMAKIAANAFFPNCQTPARR